MGAAVHRPPTSLFSVLLKIAREETLEGFLYRNIKNSIFLHSLPVHRRVGLQRRLRQKDAKLHRNGPTFPARSRVHVPHEHPARGQHVQVSRRDLDTEELASELVS